MKRITSNWRPNRRLASPFFQTYSTPIPASPNRSLSVELLGVIATHLDVHGLMASLLTGVLNRGGRGCAVRQISDKGIVTRQ